jgi:hypothetical protein
MLPQQSVGEYIQLQFETFDVAQPQTGTHISDGTKSKVYIKQKIASEIRCALCEGLVDSGKAESYDHIKPVRKGGTGDVSNVQQVHPYCNSIEKGKTEFGEEDE